MGLGITDSLGIIKGSPNWFLFCHLLAKINTCYHHNLCKTSDCVCLAGKTIRETKTFPSCRDILFLFLINIKCTLKPEASRPKGICSEAFSSVWYTLISMSVFFNAYLIFLWNSFGLGHKSSGEWKKLMQIKYFIQRTLYVFYLFFPNRLSKVWICIFYLFPSPMIS